jgi:outer membrane protein assembly factor BamB
MTRPILPGRRSLLLAGLGALPGCSLWDEVFGDNKAKLAGERQSVLPPPKTLAESEVRPASVVVPAPVSHADWPQPGGTPAHEGGHLAMPGGFERAWTASIGESSGYRRRITAQPVVAGGRVFTMDADAVVSAFDAVSGRSVWRSGTEGADDRSTNVGGGIAVDGEVLYAATGRADLVAFEAATGKEIWRARLAAPARSSPTVAGERVFVGTLDNQMLGLSAKDGARLWSFQSQSSETPVLGLPAPAHVDGFVIAGFGSGELAALRATTGGVAWSDSLAVGGGRTSITDLSAVMGMPMTGGGRVFATSLGGQLLAIDLRSGRRLWDLDVVSQQAPWIAGEWLFVASSDAKVGAVSAADGSLAWVTQLDRYENPAKERDPIRWTGPVLAGGRLVLTSSQGRAVLLDPANGAVAGGFSLPSAASLAPVVAGGTMYMVTDNATLLALR